jgi:23S rRNA pseudouridine1911/1915/1917 synthase
MLTEGRVLYEDNHLIAVNKNPSDIVQGDKTGDKPLSQIVADYLKVKYNKPGDAFIGVIHRIDRPVSGVVLFAKTSKGLSRMSRLFQQKEIQKTYWAVVENPPADTEGTLIDYLVKNQKKNKSFVTGKDQDGASRSELTYRVIEQMDRYTALEVKPKTGRHHQIRVQLSAMGCVIKGDLKYGARRSNKDASIHLHARNVEFMHPIKNIPISITAPVPNDSLWKAVEQKKQ